MAISSGGAALLVDTQGGGSRRLLALFDTLGNLHTVFAVSSLVSHVAMTDSLLLFSTTLRDSTVISAFALPPTGRGHRDPVDYRLRIRKPLSR
jgi:hypothetical protein